MYLQKHNDYSSQIHPNQNTNPFKDSISSISWAPNGSYMFATTSWDGQLRVFQILFQTNKQLRQMLIQFFNQPLMVCTWIHDCTIIFIGQIDGSIKAFNLQTSQIINIYKLSSAICSLYHIHEENALLIAGYEYNITILSLSNINFPIFIKTDYKLFTTAFRYPYLIAGMAQQKILLVNINNINNSVVTTNQAGKYSQIQSLSINPVSNEVIIGTFDGRANISTIDSNLTLKTIINFKSHKQDDIGKSLMYPTNCVQFNPLNSRWVMTAGSNGDVHCYNYVTKSKIKSFYYGSPITAIKVHPSGKFFAFAVGNDWHLGTAGLNKWETKLGVHQITDKQLVEKS